MNPTFVVLFKVNNSERLVFECDHAKTTADHIGGNGDSLRAAVQYVLMRHTETCRCQPEVIEDLWESMAYMKATIERDLAAATPADPAVLALSHQNLDSIERWACPCDPHVITTAKLGLITFTAYHQDECRKKLKRGRHASWIDFASTVTS